MTKEQFIELIENPHKMDSNSSVMLADVLKDYPYFQSAHMLYLKSLYSSKSTKYAHQLKIAATYANDRKKLYELVMQEDLQQKIQVAEKPKDSPKISDPSIEKQILQEAINASILLEVKKTTAPESKPKNQNPAKEEKTVEPNITKIGEKSFNEWLHMYSASVKQIDNPTKTESNIIDKFIEENPRISRNTTKEQTDNDQESNKTEFFSPVNTARLSIIDKEEFVTETLAKIYESQGYNDKAIKAYEILSLKNPKKSDTFAALIQKIKEKTKS